MRLLKLMMIVLFVSGITTVANAQSEKEKNTSKANVAEKVDVYYFHATRRCKTCQSVENAARKVVDELALENVVLTTINRDEDEENPLIEKHKINGQTLLVVSGDEVVDLTNYAFMYAMTKPKKVEKKIKSTIDSLQ